MPLKLGKHVVKTATVPCEEGHAVFYCTHPYWYTSIGQLNGTIHIECKLGDPKKGHFKQTYSHEKKIEERNAPRNAYMSV